MPSLNRFANNYFHAIPHLIYNDLHGKEKFYALCAAGSLIILPIPVVIGILKGIGSYSDYRKNKKATATPKATSASKKAARVAKKLQVDPIKEEQNRKEMVAIWEKFYAEGGKDVERRTLNHIWKFSLNELEMGHSYIQWLFPATIESDFNKKSPTFKDEDYENFKQNPVIVKNIKKSFDVILSLYDLKYDEENKTVTFAKIYTDVPAKKNEKQKDQIDLWYEHNKTWFKQGNHNFKRISRILACLKGFGLDDEAKAFFNCLTQLKDRFQEITSKSYPTWQERAGIAVEEDRPDDTSEVGTQ